MHAIINMVEYVIDGNQKESWTQYSSLWYSAHYFSLVRVYWFAICSKLANFLLALCKEIHQPVYNSLIDADILECSRL